MKRNILIVLLTMMLCTGALLLTGCGDDGFAEYMKGQPTMRSSIDAQLAVLSEDAKGSVQYTENGAEVTVDYYALTQAELEGEETEKTTRRCEIILQDALDGYHEETGKTATVKVVLYGHDVEKK